MPDFTFNRPPRQSIPTLPVDEIDIPPPPNPPPPPSTNWLIGALPVMGIGVMALFYVWRAATVRGSSALFAVPLFILAVFAIGGTVLAGRWRTREHERQMAERKLNYVYTLEKKRARLHAAHLAQRGILEIAFPHAETMLGRVLETDSTLWERRPDDPDFAAIRVGIGRTLSPVPIKSPDPDNTSQELGLALQLADRYRYLDHAPVVIPTRDHFAVGMCGRRDLLMGAVRAVIAQVAYAHAPTDLHIFVIAPGSEPGEWGWTQWLPHIRHSGRVRLALDATTTRALLGGLSQTVDARRTTNTRTPHLLVIFDNPQLAESEAVYSALLNEGYAVGASVICLTKTFDAVPGACTAVVDILNNAAFRCVFRGEAESIRGDQVDTLAIGQAEHIARGLASVKLREAGTSGRIPQQVGFIDLYGMNRVEDLKGYLRARWQRDIPDGVLPFPVPIGRESLTTTTYLLLDEDHHGPHGMLAGTTGSGKSELLQTLVAALALEHDPRLLNFLLIDFKGGSAFNAFAELPHTVGMVTNLDGALVERALEALKAETRYRQQFLKHMNVRDITQYYRFYVPSYAHLNDSGFQPLPHLFIIVDEFAQLAKEMPDFMRELVRTAQVGRSLGLHLLLGTQSPMDVITDEMNANLQFRICLRVQNVEASRAVLRRPDAAYLPAGLAGRGYFQVGERGVYKQFQTAYAGADYQGGSEVFRDPAVLEIVTLAGDRIPLLDPAADFVDAIPSANSEPYTTARAVIDVIHDYTESNDLTYMPPLLLPPLGERLSLEEPLVMADIGGWNGSVWRDAGTDEAGNPIETGSAPIGVIDNVYTRQQLPLWVHLSAEEKEYGRSGSLLIVGGPGSGKTTALQSLAVSQALLHSPNDLHIYTLSFTGNGLNALSHLPHSERVVHGSETERVRRLFGRLMKTLNGRKTSRQRHHRPLILLLVDQYEQLRDTYYEQHLPDFERLISEGRGVGMFVAVTASTVSAIPDRVRALIGQRIALRLSNGSDYLVAVGQVNSDLYHNLPSGRGFLAGSPPLVCQISLPVIGSAVNIEEQERQTRKLINDMRQALARQGRMQAPAAITELPTIVPLDTLPVGEKSQAIRTPLGQLDNDALSTFTLDWVEHGPHFIVTGPPGSGKTNLLRAVLLSAAYIYPPDELRFLLIDFTGRNLRELETLKHVIACVTNPLEMETHLRYLQAEMTAFAAQPQQKHPHTVVFIDDYEIAADVLSMNLDYLRQMRDHIRLHTTLGLHIWTAGYLERVGDPLMKQLLLRRSGFALQERDSLHNLNVRVSDLPNETMPVGRAYLAQHNQVSVLQTALVDDVPGYVFDLNNVRWRKSDAAEWLAQMPHSLPSEVHDPHAEVNGGGGSHGALDIDTDGLIEDLLGNIEDE